MAALISAAYPGLSYVVAGAEVKPTDVDRVGRAVRVIAADLRAGNISDDEFERAITPTLEQLSAHDSSNGYWLAVIAEAQSRPDRMERSKLSTIEAALRRISITDLVRLANKWLADDQALEVMIIPRGQDGLAK